MAKNKKKSKNRRKKGRLNTRLLMIIGLSTVIVGGIGAGLIFLHVKGSVSRNLHAGSAYIEEGNWDKAERAYGRVLRKDPSNDEAIAGLLSVYDHWVPSTREHAEILRQQYFAAVVHDMSYHPGNDAKAMRVMDSDFVNEGGESLARSTRRLSETMKAKVGGHAQHYGLLMAFGVILFFLWAVTLR